jgi:hypothetical protein
MSSLVNYTEWLLFHLWKRIDGKSRSTSPKDLGFLVPNTLVYRWSQPSCWFFTTQDGELRRKKKEKITSQLIEETVARNSSKCGILATAMYERNPPVIRASKRDLQSKQLAAAAISGVDQKNGRQVVVEVEYLDRSDLGILP